MKQCPKCNTSHAKTGVYCSRPCANSRIFSDATNKKRSLSNKKAIASFSIDKKVEIESKRINTYRRNTPINVCLDCSKVISRANKHNRCQACYFKSDISAYATGHYRKYKRLAVVDSFGNSVYLMSSLEIRYYEWLLKNNTRWVKPESIRYVDRAEKSRWYKPDFHLIDSNKIIEIKGYMWDNDKHKMSCVIEQHPDLNINILYKKDLDFIGA
jgi:hypothetical protein